MAMFSTIAAAVSATAAVASTAASFVQASKQKKLQQKAEREADKAFAEAEKELEVNYMKELSIAKQPYEIQRERLASLAAQGMDIGAESDRLASATAGRVLAQAQKTEQDITSSQVADLQDLNKEIAKTEQDLAIKRANLNLGVVQGAGVAAAQAAQLRQQANQQGIEGIQNSLTALTSEDLIPLYQGGGNDLSSVTTTGLNNPSGDNQIILPPSSNDIFFQQQQVIPPQPTVS